MVPGLRGAFPPGAFARPKFAEDLIEKFLQRILLALEVPASGRAPNGFRSPSGSPLPAGGEAAVRDFHGVPSPAYRHGRKNRPPNMTSF